MSRSHLMLTRLGVDGCAGSEHYRTYPAPQTAASHDSASVDTPLGRTTGPTGSNDLSYGSTASWDSGLDEMPEIPETPGERFHPVDIGHLVAPALVNAMVFKNLILVAC